MTVVLTDGTAIKNSCEMAKFKSPMQIAIYGILIGFEMVTLNSLELC